MKAHLLSISALPLDRMELRPLPPGVLDVQLRFYADKEAYDRIVEFFQQYAPPASQDTNERAVPEAPRALPEPVRALPKAKTRRRA